MWHYAERLCKSRSLFLGRVGAPFRGSTMHSMAGGTPHFGAGG
jgi:hypothetical protein